MAAATSTCMLALLLPFVFDCSAAPLVHPAAADAGGATPQGREDKALQALDAWLKLYRSFAMDLREKDIAKDSIAVKYGIAPKTGLRKPTWLGDLEAILEAVVRIDDANAARALLAVAAVGLDATGKYAPQMAPHAVRDAGEASVAKLTSAVAKEALATAARGELEVKQAFRAAMQSAALRCLGRTGDVAFRSVLELALGAGDEMVRLAAAEALGTLGDEAAPLPLVALLDRETVDAVLIAATWSLRRLFTKYLPKTGDGAAEPARDASAPKERPGSLKLAAGSAIRALGRTTWRADAALIQLLDEFRTVEAVPALVAQLERFKAHPEEVKSGKLSGLVLCRAHGLLVSMTGAVFPADQPEKWRAFWDAEKDRLTVLEKGKAAPAVPPAASFFDIPIHGTRVAFLLDVSNHMDWSMDRVEADGRKTLQKRIDFAKKELSRAMDVLAPNAMFNLVTFNGDDKAEVWKKDLQPATEGNRKQFKKYVEEMRALGGTNLWAGLQEALRINSLVYGNRSSHIDELFVVSSGEPTVGEVQDPIEMLRLVQEWNRFACVRINTILLTAEAPPGLRPRMGITPQEFMRRMAEQNGGKFKEP